MTKEEMAAVDAAIIRGDRQCDIHRRFHIPRCAVARRAKVLRDREKPRVPRPGALPHVREELHKKVRVGRLSDILNNLTPEELAWIRQSVPMGCTVADLIAGIIKDTIAGEPL